MKIFSFSISTEQVLSAAIVSSLAFVLTLPIRKYFERKKEEGGFYSLPWFMVKFIHKPQKIFCKCFKKSCEGRFGKDCFEHFEPLLNNSILQAELSNNPGGVNLHYDLMIDIYDEKFSEERPSDNKCYSSIYDFSEILKNLFQQYYKELDRIARKYKNEELRVIADYALENFKKIRDFFRKKPTPPTEPPWDWKGDEWQSLYQFCKVRSEKKISTLRKNGKYVFNEEQSKNSYINRGIFGVHEDYQSFDELLSSKRDIILIGKAGSGKTNEICKFVENQISPNYNNCVLFYTGSHLVNLKGWKKPANLKPLIEDLIRPNGEADYDELMEKINSLAKKENQHFVIAVDAVNEFSDPEKPFCNPFFLCQHMITLSEYNKDKGFDRIRLILSMREETYKFIQGTKIIDALKSSFAICELKDLSDEELENAYDLYTKDSDISTKFESLNEKTKHLCKEPFFLKLLCSTYSGKSLEGPFSKSKVFKEYYGKYVFSKDRTKSKLEKKDLINSILNTMVSKHTDRLSLNEAPVSQRLNDDSTSSKSVKTFYDSYFRLKEDNILFEEDGIIKFCLEPFFEWLLTEHSKLRDYTAEEIKDLLKKSGYLASYWRAAGIHLVASEKHLAIGDLITFDKPKLDIFLVDSLSTTIVEYPKSTIKILGKLVRSMGDQKKAEIAILAIYQIFCKYSDRLDKKALNHLIKLYIRGLRSPNDYVSDLAKQHLALLWDDTITRAVGETIIRRIAEKVGFFYLSFLGLRWITRIGIGKERTVTVLLDMTLLIIGEHLENKNKFTEFLNHIEKPLIFLLPLLKLKFAKKFLVNMIVKGYRDTGKQDYAGNYKEIKYMLEEPENRHFIKWLAPYFVSPGFFQKEKEILDGAKLNNGMVAWLLQAAFTVRANDDNDVDRILYLMERMFEASDQMISQWNVIRSLFRIYIANYYLAKYKSESTCLNKMNMEKIEAKFYEFSEEFVARNTGIVKLKSNMGERTYKDTTLYYSFLIDGLDGRNSFRLLNRSILQARGEKNLEFLENIHESVSKAGGWMYYEIALNELQQPIHENLKAITNQQIADSYSGKEYELLVGTLVNIRGRYKENVDNFLKMIEEESRVTGDVPPDDIEKLIKEIQNTRMKLDMRLFRTVYGQLVYFKMAMFYPECIKIFSEALDEAIDQKTVENFFYCFIEHLSGWLLREYYERAAEGK